MLSSWMPKTRCLFPQAITPFQKAACVGLGLGSLGVSIGTTYVYREKICQGIAATGHFFTEGIEALHKAIPARHSHRAQDEKDEKESKPVDTDSFAHHLLTYLRNGAEYFVCGVIIITNVPPFAIYRLCGEDRVLASPWSLVGTLVDGAFGVCAALFSVGFLIDQTKIVKVLIGQTTECCLIARTVFLKTLFGGPVIAFAALASFVSLNYASKRFMKTLDHISNGETDWNLMFETFDDQNDDDDDDI